MRRWEYWAIGALTVICLGLGTLINQYAQAERASDSANAYTQGAALLQLRISLRTISQDLSEIDAGERPLADLPRIQQEVYAAQRLASLLRWEPFIRLNGALGLAQLDVTAAGETLTDVERLRIGQVRHLTGVIADLLPQPILLSGEFPLTEAEARIMTDAISQFMDEPHRRMR